MSDNVLHGTGRPRIVIDEDYVLTGYVVSASGVQVVLQDSPSISDSVLNRYFKSWNAANEVTFGKVVSYDDSTDTIVVDNFNNGLPVNGKVYYVEDFVIDLPYCQSLVEAFTPDFKATKKLYNSGRLYNTLKGFYYTAYLDYSKYITKDTLLLLQKIYSTLCIEFTFIPRRDNLNIAYLVMLDPETALQIAQLPFNQGHKLVSIKLTGLERLSQVPLSE